MGVVLRQPRYSADILTYHYGQKICWTFLRPGQGAIPNISINVPLSNHQEIQALITIVQREKGHLQIHRTSLRTRKIISNGNRIAKPAHLLNLTHLGLLIHMDPLTLLPPNHKVGEACSPSVHGDSLEARIPPKLIRAAIVDRAQQAHIGLTTSGRNLPRHRKRNGIPPHFQAKPVRAVLIPT
jgi:hypothetical protein